MADPATQRPLRLGAASLTLGDVTAVARERRGLEVAPEAMARVDASRAVVEDWLQSGKVAYGINTGFGSLASVRISPEDIETLQENLIQSHCAGVGTPMPEDVVRALMLLRATALLQGCSGIRMECVRLLLDMLERGVHPVIPCQGSVGASGDLAPLAHLALAMIGRGEVVRDGARLRADAALAGAGLAPVRLQAKEGLALINGTQAMAAYGSLALHDLGVALRSADAIAAMSLEALMGTDASLHPRLHEVRRQEGQVASARNLRQMVAGSPLIASHKHCDQVQDAYSLRCVPQVHGAARDVWAFAAGVLEREINAVTDNPLVFVESNEIVSGGNFHGAPVAMALDAVALAPVYLCNISERRTYRLLDGARSGLPPFLSRQSGLDSGWMLAQYTAAALTSENKGLAHPSSADTIPTSAGQEDHVSMGLWSARKLARLVDHVFLVLGIEALCAAQALDFRRPLAFGPGTEAAYAAVRSEFPPLEHDRVLSGELQAAAEMVRSARLLRAVEVVTGDLK